jgi:YVTN family beta-propeller protein
VSIIDVDTKKIIQTLSVGAKRSNRLKFTPDGKFVLLSDRDGGELIVLDRATTRERARIAMGRYPKGIQVESGGGRAYVAQEGANDVAIVDLKTLTVTGHISPGNGPDGLGPCESSADYFGSVVPRCNRSLLSSRQTYSWISHPCRH